MSLDFRDNFHLVKYSYWTEASQMVPYKFVCGYCAQACVSERGWTAREPGVSLGYGYIYLCIHCARPNFFERSKQHPNATYGLFVSNISDETSSKLYTEARSCYSVNAYTACVMLLRKLLMHLAVHCGADENKPFAFYVQFLSENGHVPKNAQPLLEKIRQTGNEANHEIILTNDKDARQLLDLTGYLLKFMYEMPAQLGIPETPVPATP